MFSQRRFLIILLTIGWFCILNPVAAQEPGRDGDDQFSTSSLELTGSGWIEGGPYRSASAAATVVLDPVDCKGMSSPVVGYEVSKEQDPNDVAGFINNLTTNGFSVGTVDINLATIPPCVDILIVHGLAHNSHLAAAYSQDEGNLLKNWTADGHGLMLNGDWGAFKTETQALFEAFGYSQLGGAVRDPTDFDPAGPTIDPTIWVIYQTDNFTGHPGLAGVTALQLQAGSWLTPANNAIVTTDVDANPALAPVMAAFDHDAGCVALTTDSNWYATDNGIGGYAKQDNAKVASQMMAWLNDCSPLAPTSTKLFLPLILRTFSQRTSFPLFIGPAIPSRPIAFQGEVFYTTSVQIPSSLPVGGKFYFSSEPDRVSPVVVDDDLVVQQDSLNRFIYHFSPGGRPVQPAIVEVPRATMEQMAGQTVIVKYRDVYAGVIYASEIRLIWTP
ncbi:MAG: hypothetical protein KDI02_17090 [Anaerolineae bacterium]|nr:hypothetical protein [Anaerolineae bacterium]MCB9101121.1 hypothetical protein [Anaerolineales bacterium]